MEKEKKKKLIKIGIPFVCVFALGSTYIASTLSSREPVDTITSKKGMTKEDRKKQVENFIKDVEVPKKKSILDKIGKSPVIPNILEQAKSSDYQSLDRNQLTLDLLAFTANSKENDKEQKVDKNNVAINVEKPNEPLNPNLDPPINNVPVEPEPPIDIPPIIVVDYSVLESVYNEAKEIDLALYLSSSIQHFSDEMLVSERILVERNSSQSQVNAQILALEGAIKNLVRKGDKSELQLLLEKAKKIDKEIYTSASIYALEQEIKNTENMLTIDEFSQEEIDIQVKRLKDSLDNLKKIDDTSLSLLQLKRLVKEYEAIEQSLYTENSLIAFNEALAQAKQLIESENITKEQLDNQYDVLKLAREQLIEKESDESIKPTENITSKEVDEEQTSMIESESNKEQISMIESESNKEQAYMIESESNEEQAISPIKEHTSATHQLDTLLDTGNDEKINQTI